uniref:Uncharacterized protein n=1 Tax=viral metagenome TaxID=1070528 RepID=A0A6H1Z946_9ZZZZ
MNEANVRTERSFNHYSRGFELAKAIKQMWAKNRATPYISSRSETINQRIADLMVEFDLNLDEWHHWAKELSNWDNHQ